MGLQGNIHDMSVADLIQQLCNDHKKAQLLIEKGSESASLYFKDGNVVHARLGSDEGEEAVYQLLAWEDGTFTLNNDVEASKVTVERSWSGLLMEGAKRLDEQNLAAKTAAVDPKNTKEVGFMAGKMEELLQEMGGEMNGFIAATVAGMDGISIAQTSGGSVDIDTVVGQLTVFLKLAGSSSEKANMGAFEDILLQTDKEFILVSFLPGDTQHYMATIVDRKNGSLGNMRLIGKVYSERFSKIIPR